MLHHASQRGRLQVSDTSPPAPPPPLQPPRRDRSFRFYPTNFRQRHKDEGGGADRYQISLLCFKLQQNCSTHFLPSVRAPESQTRPTLAFPRSCTHPSHTRASDAASLRLGEGGVGEDRKGQCKLRGTRRGLDASSLRALGPRNKEEAGPVRGRAARRAGAPPVLLHSLCVASGPGQPPGLLEDEDGASDVVGAALHLVLRQPQELRSPVGETQGQVRASAAAAAVLGAGAASHDAAHEIGHGRFHSSEHITPAPRSSVASRRRRRGHRWAQRGACRLRREPGARAAGLLGRAPRLPEPSAAGGRAPASRAPCRRRLPPLHFRNGEAWRRSAGQGETLRAPGAAAAAGPFSSAALDSCVSGTETTKRARGARTAAATATAAVESCDNQAARALAAVAGAQPLPCRLEQGSHQNRDLLGEGEPGRVGTWRRGWGRCEPEPVQVLGDVTWSHAAGKSQLKNPLSEECTLRLWERKLGEPDGQGETGGILVKDRFQVLQCK